MARFVLPIWQIVNDDAKAASGWKLGFFESGTTTRKDTYSDSDLSTANANPVVCNSSGRFPDIFMGAGAYKVVLTDALDVVKWTADPVDGSVGATGAVDSKTADFSPTVADASKLFVVDATDGDVTVSLPSAATVGNGVEIGFKKADSSSNTITLDPNGSETVDGAASVVLTFENEVVVIRSDGTNWKIVSRQFVGGPLSKAVDEAKGADLASAATVNIGAATGNYVKITGTTTITAFDTVQAGTRRMVEFGGALTLTHNATSLILPTGANITTAAGDVATFVSEGSGNWRCANYMLASGKPLAGLGLLTTASWTSTSGTSHDFSSLSSALNEITLYFDQVSQNADNTVLLVQIGDGTGGLKTTGYTGYNMTVSGASAGVFTYANSNANGFALTNNVSYDAASQFTGVITLRHLGSNVWCCAATGGDGGTGVYTQQGIVTLSAALDRVRVTTSAGTNTFDNGTVYLAGKA